MVKTNENQELWIRSFHPAGPSDVRLVCFPHTGGSASFYRPVSALLSPAMSVLAVQYPGRQDRRMENGVSSIPDLADQIFDALKSRLDRPLALFGHSMGAVLAFEVARRLEQEAGDAALIGLFASGRRAPSRYRDDQVHLRDDDGLVAELKLLGGTDWSLLGDEEFLRMLLPVMRCDYKAIESYRCVGEATLACPVTALTGDADPVTSLDEASAWKEHTTAPFDIHVYPGGHFYLSDHRQEITDLIRTHLIMSACT